MPLELELERGTAIHSATKILVSPAFSSLSVLTEVISSTEMKWHIVRNDYILKILLNISIVSIRKEDEPGSDDDR